MKTFKDNEGREWVVAINVAQHKRVRDLAGVDIYALVDDDFQGLAALTRDVAKLVDVLYVLCRDQAEKRGVSDWDFGAAIAGDTILAASDAFLDELVDFFPDPRVRGALGGLMRTGRAVRGEMLGMLERMTPTLAEVDPADVARRLIGSSGVSPASSGSTPAP